jgi:dTDP-4-dehydrorhamnose 3,5-epimerase
MDKVIDGVKIVPLKIINNINGNVLHIIRNDDPNFLGFGECYCSELLYNKIKGWKKHKLQTQNLTVPSGLVKFVLFDSRPNSKTNGLIMELYLGRLNNYNRLTIPPNIWYSFKGIINEVSLIVNCSDIPHDIDESETLDLENSLIPYKWEK